MTNTRVSGFALFAVAASMMVLTSCLSWEEREEIESVAWASDDSAIAFVIGRFESADAGADPFVGGTRSRNHRHRLYVEQPDGAGRTAITGEIAGRTTELYYMKSQNYFLSGVSSHAEGRWFNRIASDGTVREVARVAASAGPCEQHPFDVVPSPDGLHLAVLEVAPGCDSAPEPSFNPTGDLRVTFLDAATLSSVQSQTITVPFRGGIAWTWRPAGDFVVAGGDSAWSLTPDRAPQGTSVPQCFQPKTSSSEWSSTGSFAGSRVRASQLHGGAHLEHDDAHDDLAIVVVEDHTASMAFGCQ